MRTTLHLLLILCLMLTGIGLGAARGTVQLAGQVVICTGEGVVIRHVSGAPSKTEAHVCPDMALTLLNHAATDADMPMPGFRISEFVPEQANSSPISRATPVASARDPPMILDSKHETKIL